jgi:small subunit ribosomal protein S3Ae
MAKEKKSTKELLKWKKKKWVQIIAPTLMNSMVLGESLVLSPESLIGKTIESNLMVLSGDIKKQHISIKFLIDSVREGMAHTKILSYKLSPSTIKRNVRRKRDRIDTVIYCKTKDEKNITVKFILITRNNTVRSALTMLRKKTAELIHRYYFQMTFDDAMIDAVDFKTQGELKKELKYIYPLRSCEIKYLGLSTGKKK